MFTQGTKASPNNVFLATFNVIPTLDFEWGPKGNCVKQQGDLDLVHQQ